VVTLEAIPLFRQLNRIELQALRLITQERQFAAGQEIFHEGAPGDGVYFVKAGLVEISAGTGVARRVVSRLGCGAIFSFTLPGAQKIERREKFNSTFANRNSKFPP
jgi:CRP-like cAMP-binding protein